MLANVKTIHFIGIGGIGMSALAHVLHKQGYNVTGSDAKGSEVVERLISEGIKVYIGHEASQVNTADMVVLSTAIHQDNPEYMQAKKLNLPIVHRSDILYHIVNKGDCVAVAGAHGKTTTTSMISFIAYKAGLDPTFLIGGDVSSLGGNARLGQGQYAITEADESDGSFLKLNPKIAIITNIEDDHLDYYKTVENIYLAFSDFLKKVVLGGTAIVCYDNFPAMSIATNSPTKVISYAINNKADVRATNIVYGKEKTTYDLYVHESKLAKITLKIPGRHNVLNSLAAIIACMNMGIDINNIQKALKEFYGVKRRFETKYKDDKIWIIDDYAHHPTEIEMTLKAGWQKQPKRLIGVFQPHRYSRMQLLLDDFAKSFELCDLLVLTDIYSAGEDPIEGVSTLNLMEAIKALYPNKEILYIPDVNDIPKAAKADITEGDLVIFMGAGSISQAAETIAADYAKLRKE